MVDLKCQNCKAWSNSMLGDLCGHEIDQITSSKDVMSCKKGQTLFFEGGRPNGVYCIHKGRVKIYKRGVEGKEQILYLCSPGDMLGYNALISDASYALSAEVMEDSIVCFIPKEEFFKGLKDSDGFREILFKTVCQQEALLAQMVTGLAQKSVRQRLAAALIMLNDKYQDTETNISEISLSREDLANIVGTATESVIRLLNDFKEEKLVASNGRKLQVLSTDKLRQVANIY